MAAWIPSLINEVTPPSISEIVAALARTAAAELYSGDYARLAHRWASAKR